MKKILTSLILILSFINCKAQECTGNYVEATVEFFTGANSADKHWFIVEDATSDTVLSYAPKNSKTVISDYTDSVQFVCLEIGKSYTYYAYSISGFGWDQGFLSLFINDNPVVFSHGQEPNNYLPDTVSTDSYVARPYDLESKETFVVQPINENDLKITSIELAKTNCELSEKQEIKIKIANIGSITQLGTTVGLEINNEIVALERIFDYFSPLNLYENIDSINLVEYTFKATPDMSAKGIYNVKVFVEDDDNIANDTLKTIIEIVSSTDTVQHQTTKEYIGYYNPVVETKMTFCGLNDKMTDDYGIQYLKIDSLVHSYMTDMVLYLVSPENDTLLLSYRAGLNVDDILILGGRGFYNTTFTDTSSSNIRSAISAIFKDDYFHADQKSGFSTFNGQNPNGQWTLGIHDLFSYNGGVFYGWSMAIGSKKLSGISQPNIKTVHSLIYPNPANDVLNIQTSEYLGNAEYSIITTQGSVVANGRISSLRSVVDISMLPKGIYFLCLKSELKQEIKKFTKN